MSPRARSVLATALLTSLAPTSVWGVQSDAAQPASPAAAPAPSDAGAQALGPSSNPKPSPVARCSAPEQRQFDFWVGDWEVHTTDGKLAGTNRIERTLDGCVLQENWSGQGGIRGTSLNAYSPLDRMWHQTWMDLDGLVLELSGEFRDGKMVLSGDSPSPEEPGKTVANRITWQALEDGSVRQLWETSGDGGATWTVAFDGNYRRKG